MQTSLVTHAARRENVESSATRLDGVNTIIFAGGENVDEPRHPHIESNNNKAKEDGNFRPLFYSVVSGTSGATAAGCAE